MKQKHSRLLLVAALSLGSLSVISLTPTQAYAARKKNAQDAPRLVVVGPVTGLMKFSVRQWMRGALDGAPDQFATVDDEKSKELAEGANEKALAGFAKKNKAKAIIVGDVKKTPKGYTLTVAVHGPDGVEMDGVEFEGATAAKLRKSVESSLVLALQGVLGMGAAAPAAPTLEKGEVAPEAVVLEEDENAGKKAAPKDEGKESADEEPEPLDSEPKSEGLTPLKFELGGRLRGRSLTYTDPLDAFYPGLRDVEFPAAGGGQESGARYPLTDYSLAYPGVFLGLEWYPLAHWMQGIPTYFGIVGNFQKDALMTTTALETPTGETDIISTSSFSYFAGLKARVPLGKHQVAAFGGIGRHTFDVGTEANDTVDELDANGMFLRTRVSEVTVPSVDYGYWRAGVEGTIDLGALAITANGAYRGVGSVGELQSDDWFPYAKAIGWDAGVKGEIPLTELMGGTLALAVGVDVTRYAWKANSSPDDVAVARVAGGGVDSYVSGWAGLSFALPGAGGGSSAKASTSTDEAEKTSTDKESEDSESADDSKSVSDESEESDEDESDE